MHCQLADIHTSLSGEAVQKVGTCHFLLASGREDPVEKNSLRIVRVWLMEASQQAVTEEGHSKTRSVLRYLLGSLW